ncbi:hypothetical protein Fot_32760 [Forsythia ovata]|uniref:Uncharacterized protein n=1 Tax=Forsythia ovata TaxID=205694 RepID=A0ABD1T8Q0_9LAMI
MWPSYGIKRNIIRGQKWEEIIVENEDGNVEDQVHMEESEIEQGQLNMEQTHDEVLMYSDYEAHEDLEPNTGAENLTLNIDIGIHKVNAQATNGEDIEYSEEDELESLDNDNEDAIRKTSRQFYFNSRTDMECTRLVVMA